MTALWAARAAGQPHLEQADDGADGAVTIWTRKAMPMPHACAQALVDRYCTNDLDWWVWTNVGQPINAAPAMAVSHEIFLDFIRLSSTLRVSDPAHPQFVMQGYAIARIEAYVFKNVTCFRNFPLNNNISG